MKRYSSVINELDRAVLTVEISRDDVHVYDVVGGEVAHDGAASAAYRLKADLLVAGDTSLIIVVDPEHHVMEVQVPERVVEEEP